MDASQKTKFTAKRLRMMYAKRRLDKVLEKRAVNAAGVAVYKGLLAREWAMRESGMYAAHGYRSQRGGLPVEGRFQTHEEPNGPWVFFRSKVEARHLALLNRDDEGIINTYLTIPRFRKVSARNKWVFRESSRRILLGFTWRSKLRKVVIAIRFMWLLTEMAAVSQCAEGGRMFREDVASYEKNFGEGDDSDSA
jgi:hypothetical protein